MKRLCIWFVLSFILKEHMEIAEQFSHGSFQPTKSEKILIIAIFSTLFLSVPLMNMKPFQDSIDMKLICKDTCT